MSHAPVTAALQEQLNRLGLTDARGRKLRVDGELGPLTTQAIKAAQERLGMRPTGIVAAAFIGRLKATKTVPKAAAKRSVTARFDPGQLRDDEGQWTKNPGGVLVDIAKKLVREIADHPSSNGEDRSDPGWAARAAGAVRGETALDSAAVKLRKAPEGHYGNYDGEGFHAAPDGHGDVRALSEMEGTEYQSTNSWLWDRGKNPDRDRTKTADGRPHSAEDQELLDEIDQQNQRRVDEVDKSMAVSPLSRDTLVYRGVKSGSDTFGSGVWYGFTPREPGKEPDFALEDAEWERFEQGWRPDLTGLEWTQHSYLHTTVRPELMSDYARNLGGTSHMPVVMTIVLPKGTPAIRMSELDQEAELMAARGLKLRVVADHGEDANGVRHLDIEVVM